MLRLSKNCEFMVKTAPLKALFGDQIQANLQLIGR
jgi:hypothetical protein